MRAVQGLLELLFPRKCVFCGRLLDREETDLCRGCRRDVPVFSPGRRSIPFVSAWTAAYCYEGLVRDSLLRFKFGGRESYAAAYGRALAARIQEELEGEFDLLTYVPVSARRRFHRGYDQVRLLAGAVGRELGQKPVRTLRKRRHNSAQSSLSGREQRRANVLGAYTAVDAELVEGKRVLLIDDVITTGATISECARILRTVGAREVVCATLARARG